MNNPTKREAELLLEDYLAIIEDQPTLFDKHSKKAQDVIKATLFYLQNSRYDIKDRKLTEQAILFEEEPIFYEENNNE